MMLASKLAAPLWLQAQAPFTVDLNPIKLQTYSLSTENRPLSLVEVFEEPSTVDDYISEPDETVIEE